MLCFPAGKPYYCTDLIFNPNRLLKNSILQVIARSVSDVAISKYLILL
jgi:hypothetical protein